MAKSLIHAGSGPRYGRGRKHIIRARCTKAQIALILGFLVFVIVTLIAGMYLGWLSSQEEEQTNSPETEMFAPL